MNKKIGVVGLWHLGCVLCACWQKLNNSVVGFDYDVALIKKLNRGILPLFEPGLSETICQGLKKNSLKFSSDITSLAACDYVFLAYDTPVRDDDSSDTAILEKVISDLCEAIKNETVIIVTSQLPVGFCRFLGTKLKEKKSNLELAYSPENLRLGEAIRCYLNPGRIILGTASREVEKKCYELFSQIKTNIISCSFESAEMIKHGINSFLATSIVFANNLADICEYVGADIDEVVRGIKSDPRIGEKAYLSAGIGFSGGTLGRDLVVLKQKNLEGGKTATLFDIVYSLNKQRKLVIFQKIEKVLKKHQIKSPRIGIIGLTYKSGTSTLRRSVPLEIVNLLLEKKYEVKVYDPKADYTELDYIPAFEISNDIKEVTKHVDLIVLFTDWPEFKEYDWSNVAGHMRTPLVLDTKNFLSKQTMISFGFNYYGVGR